MTKDSCQGIMLFFDTAFLAMGNILFLTGLTLIIGPAKTTMFFARRNKLRGSICFFGGILLVFMRRPVIGVFVELFGFINLLYGPCLLRAPPMLTICLAETFSRW